MRATRWTPSKYVWFALFGMTVLWLTVGSLIAFGQEVVHYEGERVALESGDLFQPHLLIGSDGRAAAVVLIGPPGTQPKGGAAAGPITQSEEEEGMVAFCFVIDELEGIAPAAFMGKTSCYVVLLEVKEAFETGDTLWGEATSARMTFCEEEHVVEPDSPLRQPGART